jgi:hypothetical protein
VTTAILTDITDIREGLRLRRQFAITVREWLVRHRLTALVLTPVLGVVAVVHAVGMSTFPDYVDDPGTYLSQAWSVEYEHSLSPYSYFYDHAPAGWIQIALWATLTGGFNRYGSAIAFGNECMLIAKVVSAALLYGLGRRLGFSRIGAAGATLLFGLCPLELVYGRWTFLDNLVTPWLLLAFLLAYSPRRTIWAGTAAALSFAMATLTKETALVLLPAFAWAMAQNLDRRNRAQVVAVSACSGVLLMALYPLLALFKGELFEGAGHNSLLGTAMWQLTGRGSSGSVLDPHSPMHVTYERWLGYDHYLILLGLAAIPVALLVRRLRPVTLALAIQWLIMVRGGYVPFMHVINLMPWSALAVAGVLEAVAGNRRVLEGGWLRVRRPDRAAGQWARVALAALLAVALAVQIGRVWTPALHRMMTVRQQPALAAATRWLADNVPRDRVLAVHDAIWTDLVYHYGYQPRPIIVYKLDTDPAVRRVLTHLDYLVVPNWYYETPDAATKYPTLMEARKHAIVVAEFGSGNDGVQVYRVSRFWRP